jgi:ParB-like chromosome segregation protein Spo0J
MLKIVQKPVDKLIPYVNNSRTHSDEQIAQIASSIKEFGWTNPILVDGENGIIAGHGRLMAARKLGYKEVPTIELKDLTETQRKAYIIADNRLALNAGWDNEMLTIELNELLADGFALEMLGFDPAEIQSLINGGPDFQPATENEQGKLDQLDPKWIACPHCGKEFDAREA